MPLIAPVLDDRSFDDIFTELRGRIAVYNPEWTDHHDSDVGITLLQLFAFMGESLQFRFNQIPEASYIAFLKLLDIPMRAAGPARTLMRFESKVANGVSLYAGDQVKGGKTVFTLAQDTTVWPLEAVAVARQAQLDDDQLSTPGALAAFIAALPAGQSPVVQASVDALKLARGKDLRVTPYESVTLAPDGSGPAVDFANTVDGMVWVAVLASPELKIAPGKLADPGNGLQRVAGRALPLAIGVSPARTYPGLDEIGPCTEGAGPALLWQASLAKPKADGSIGFAPVRVAGDTSGGFTREGVIRLEMPLDLASLGVPPAPPGLAGTGDFPPELDDERAERLWFWLRAWRGDGSRIGALQVLTLNAVTALQVQAGQPQLLGTGTGQPDQRYALASRSVLVDTDHPFELQVEQQGVWTDWQLVDNFDAATPGAGVFSLDLEAGVVRFGDGQAGRAPQLGERIRVLAYTTGGGAAGNLPARAIDKFGDLLGSPTPPPPLRRPTQVSSLKFGNPLAAWGGVDAETLDAALRRIPTELRRNRRAVARDDFASLALETPGVALGRTECLPLFHAPSRSPKPGCVSVVIWPAQDPQHPRAPVPDAWELARTCAWLDRWRLVTTELYVIAPTYRRIALSVSVKVSEGFGLDAVRDWVETLLRQYLAPLPPYGPEGRGYPLGRRLLARELEGVAMQVEGVDYIEKLRLDVEKGADWLPAEVLQLESWEVPEIAAVTVVDGTTPLPSPGTGLNPPPSDPAVPVPVIRDEC